MRTIALLFFVVIGQLSHAGCWFSRNGNAENFERSEARDGFQNCLNKSKEVPKNLYAHVNVITLEGHSLVKFTFMMNGEIKDVATKFQ